MYRLYLEDFTNKKYWTVDDGDVSHGQRFEYIITEATGVTKVDITADNKLSPKAWIEYVDGTVLKIVGNTAILR